MTLWQKIMRPFLRSQKSNAELEQIGELQEAAKRRRAEFAAEQSRMTPTEFGHAPGSLATSRKRVIEAEAAYANAMRAWDDKQFRQ